MGLRARLRDLLKSAEQHEADEVRGLSRFEGSQPISACRQREMARIGGTVSAVTLPPVRSVPTLVVELWDGTGAVDLIFVGRRRIAGLVPGVFLRAEGRLAQSQGRRVIYNPSYQLVAR